LINEFYPRKPLEACNGSRLKFSIHAVLIFRFPFDYGYIDAIEQKQVKIMLNSLLSDVLAVAADNLNMTASVLECTTDAAVDLSPEAKQRLNLVHMGLAMAMQAMDHDELRQIMEQSDSYIPAWLSLA
jgi:hypothetical protein